MTRKAPAVARVKQGVRTNAAPVAPRAKRTRAATATSATTAAPSAGKAVAIAFHPLTPDRWKDLETLFGVRGACGGCWCMWGRLAGGDYKRGLGDPNKRAFRRIVASGEPPGILAYVGDRPAGWCAIAPRAMFTRLEASRVLKPVDDQPVWSVVCFFVARPHRRQGLSVALLEQAARFAESRGARIVEGYPVDHPGEARAADAFVWTGLASTFRHAGFHEVARRSETRPIMRRELSPASRAGTVTRVAKAPATAKTPSRARAPAAAKKPSRARTPAAATRARARRLRG